MSVVIIAVPHTDIPFATPFVLNRHPVKGMVWRQGFNLGAADPFFRWLLNSEKCFLAGVEARMTYDIV